MGCVDRSPPLRPYLLGWLPDQDVLARHGDLLESLAELGLECPIMGGCELGGDVEIGPATALFGPDRHQGFRLVGHLT